MSDVISGIKSATAGIAEAQVVAVRAVDEALEEEGHKVVEVAEKLIQPGGSESVSREIVMESFVVRPAEVGRIQGASGDIQGLSGPASKITTKTAIVAWAAGFDHAAAHQVHQRGRTKGYLSRALNARKGAIRRNVAQAVDRAFSENFRRVL